MGCLYVMAMGWGLLLTVAAFGVSHSDGVGAFMLMLLMGWVPMALLFWLGRMVESKARRLMPEVASQSGVAIDSKFFHWEGNTGLALNSSRQCVTIASGANMKTYKFADIREWAIRSETAGQVVPMGGGLAGGVAAGAANMGAGARAAANTGLFLSVKDIDQPTWRIAMQEKKKRDVWFEILTQAINEGGVSEP